jgi:hypothetical protein
VAHIHCSGESFRFGSKLSIDAGKVLYDSLAGSHALLPKENLKQMRKKKKKKQEQKYKEWKINLNSCDRFFRGVNNKM